jgi:hypothetical protein
VTVHIRYTSARPIRLRRGASRESGEAYEDARPVLANVCWLEVGDDERRQVTRVEYADGERSPLGDPAAPTWAQLAIKNDVQGHLREIPTLHCALYVTTSGLNATFARVVADRARAIPTDAGRYPRLLSVDQDQMSGYRERRELVAKLLLLKAALAIITSRHQQHERHDARESPKSRATDR